jgi:hypothetical protein
VEGDEKSPRDKIQTDTQTKTNYWDGVDEIGCYKVLSQHDVIIVNIFLN